MKTVPPTTAGPTRLALVLRDASEVHLTRGYMPFRTPVVNMSRELSRVLGVPAHEAVE